MKRYNKKKKKSIRDIIENIGTKWDLTFRRNRLIIEKEPSPFLLSKIEGEKRAIEQRERC